MKKSISKLLTVSDFILKIDFMTTKEFCEKFNVPLPVIAESEKETIRNFLRVDAIQKKLFVDYVKFLKKPITLDLFEGKNRLFQKFFEQENRGGNRRFTNGDLIITIDQYGFYLEPYDSVDGERLNLIEDLTGLDIEITKQTHYN